MCEKTSKKMGTKGIGCPNVTQGGDTARSRAKPARQNPESLASHTRRHAARGYGVHTVQAARPNKKNVLMAVERHTASSQPRQTIPRSAVVPKYAGRSTL